jgi:uncharacterized membrane protein
MSLLLFVVLAIAYAVSTWDLLRQSRLPRAAWEPGTPMGGIAGSESKVPIVIRPHGGGGRVPAASGPR